MAKQFTLGKNERLKSRKQIEQLFTEGKKISISPFIVYYKLTPLSTMDDRPDGHRESTQFGVGVSAKIFKKAVDRNRIKRLIREAYRLQKKDLVDAVRVNNRRLDLFFIYTAKKPNEFRFIYDKMTIALQKMIVEVEGQSKK